MISLLFPFKKKKKKGKHICNPGFCLFSTQIAKKYPSTFHNIVCNTVESYITSKYSAVITFTFPHFSCHSLHF